jgi:hypothetical protein
VTMWLSLFDDSKETPSLRHSGSSWVSKYFPPHTPHHRNVMSFRRWMLGVAGALCVLRGCQLWLVACKRFVPVAGVEGRSSQWTLPVQYCLFKLGHFKRHPVQVALPVAIALRLNLLSLHSFQLFVARMFSLSIMLCYGDLPLAVAAHEISP